MKKKDVDASCHQVKKKKEEKSKELSATSGNQGEGFGQGNKPRKKGRKKEAKGSGRKKVTPKNPSGDQYQPSKVKKKKTIQEGRKKIQRIKWWHHYQREKARETLDSIEFARGSSNTTWGSLRAAMGHPEPFELKYVAVGNEDCGKKNYRGNYLKYYYAIKAAYPDIKTVSNCDGSSTPLDHPADLYDFHIYTSARNLFSMSKTFDHTSRSGPKAFVSEYAVTGSDAGKGSLLAALGEAGFLMGLEKNSDVVEMASYAPLFVNDNDRRWNPDAIVFNSWQQYGTPSYWVQQFFKESSGAIYHPSTIQASSSGTLISSAIVWQNLEDNTKNLKIKIVNFGNDTVNFNISIAGLQDTVNSAKSSMTVLSSNNLMDENSFAVPNKVAPQKKAFPNAGTDMNVVISPHSLTSFDLPLGPTTYVSAI